MKLPSLLMVLATLSPMFFGSWPLALLALSAQAACGAWVGLHHAFEIDHIGSWVALVDAGLRVFMAPWLLWPVGRRSARFELLPVNIAHWFIVACIMFAGYAFGREAHALDAQAPAPAMAATAACVLFSFFVLSVQARPAAQAVAILMLENGVFMFENALEHHLPTTVQVALSVVYFATLICFRQALIASPEEGERT